LYTPPSKILQTIEDALRAPALVSITLAAAGVKIAKVSFAALAMRHVKKCTLSTRTSLRIEQQN